MPTRQNWKATKTDRELASQIVKKYYQKGKVRIKQAFKENPDWEAQLKHLPYSTIAYHVRQTVLKTKKNKEQNRKEESQIIVAPKQYIKKEIEETQEIDLLSYCPCCGKYLVNIRNALRLEEQGKV